MVNTAYFKDKEPPVISYQYTNTVANRLFNFSSTLSNLDITNYLSNPQHCQCNTSKLCYKPHGHVITGDLMVIENVKLRELVAKGPKYREPNKINWQSTETMVSNSIDLYLYCDKTLPGGCRPLYSTTYNYRCHSYSCPHRTSAYHPKI